MQILYNIRYLPIFLIPLVQLFTAVINNSLSSCELAEQGQNDLVVKRPFLFLIVIFELSFDIVYDELHQQLIFVFRVYE